MTMYLLFTVANGVRRDQAKYARSTEEVKEEVRDMAKERHFVRRLPFVLLIEAV